MELKGFKRHGRSVAMATATFGVVAMAAGLAVPVAAAQEAETWTMPDLKEEILQNAVDSVIGDAGEGNVKFNLVDSTFNQVVYNYTNWVVCSQSPKADTEVTIDPAKPRTVTLALKRPSTGC